MSIVLPNSIFYHVGRTGGHWVSHVLWRAGLVEKRLTPLHLTPAQASQGGGLDAKPVTFCFVRHPLSWARSVWLHEMEFGWSNSEVSVAAASDNFATFLSRLMEAWPNGPCTHATSPYVDDCTFVGRTEVLAQDLRKALEIANETFDLAVLDTPRINESSITRLAEVAKAPADLLAAVMATESQFNQRFGYEHVPEQMIGGESAPVWPLLRVKDDNGLCEQASALNLLQPRFDYRFDDGTLIDSQGYERATQWALTDAVMSLPAGGNCAVVSESDPYFAYLAADRGCAPVILINGGPALTSHHWSDRLASSIESQPLEQFLQSVEPAYDALVFCDSMEISIAAEVELLHAALVLKPGGVLIMTAPMLHVEGPLKTIWPLFSEGHGRKLSYYSLEYLKVLLTNLGFDTPEVVRTMFEAPPAELQQQVEALADVLKVDPDQLLGKAIIKARLKSQGGAIVTREALAQLWQLRRPADFLNTPVEGLRTATRATVAMLKADLTHERNRRAAAEQGMADRERELIATRVNLAALANDADYSRDQIARARAEAAAALARLQELTAQIEFLGLAGLDAPEDPAGEE